jgi:hypothetical protein
VLWSECVCPSPQSYVAILTPNVIVLGDGGPWGCLGHEEDRVHNEMPL